VPYKRSAPRTEPEEVQDSSWSSSLRSASARSVTYSPSMPPAEPPLEQSSIVIFGTMTITRSDVASEIGIHRKRVEDPRLLRGESQYVEDLRLEKVAEVAFVRSAYAHARITAIHTDTARRAPGVLAVWTGA